MGALEVVWWWTRRACVERCSSTTLAKLLCFRNKCRDSQISPQPARPEEEAAESAEFAAATFEHVLTWRISTSER